MSAAKEKRTAFRGPVGFTPVESRIAAILAVIVLLMTGIAVYQRLTQPVSREMFELHTLPVEDSRAPVLPTVDAATETVAPAAPTSRENKLDINAADYAELMRLPGIGPVLATRIIEYRDRHGPFPIVDSLLAVSGIGVKKLQALRAHVCVH